jgi:non-haem Fe2+, alpha-ketoglutarate-dependent halogenase
MPKVLTAAQVKQFETEGFVPPVRVLDDEEVARYRAHLESFERRHPEHVKKLKSKSHLLCPWVVDLARHPRILDVYEDLLGPNILCWSMAWRVKRNDGVTHAGWHQDTAYGGVQPLLAIGALALSECGPEQGCLKVIPGSHKWGVLPHEDSDKGDSILARGQYIAADFDQSKAVDLALRPGEISVFNSGIVHGSGTNTSIDRRIMLLVEMMSTIACQDKFRDSALLVRGVDAYGNFDEDPLPASEFAPEAVANWNRVIERRARLIFEDSKLAPSEAYGGTRAAV